MKCRKIAFVLVLFVSIACNNSNRDNNTLNLGPGYRFDLFKDTPLGPLAQAVDREDTGTIRQLINKNNLDINFKEIKSGYGVSLLFLAVGNDKLLSTKALLECRANPNILDNMGTTPIHEICHLAIPHKHRVEILQLLLQYGADANHLPHRLRIINSPLESAVGDLGCTKLLLQYGANLYYHQRDRNVNIYPIWSDMLCEDSPIQQNILVAKYLIVDKQLPMPDTLLFSRPGYKPVTSLELLNKFKVFNDPEKQKAKDDILAPTGACMSGSSA